MRRLPPHHVPRPRLTNLCLTAQVVVVEAGAGYGKTVLGVELVDAWRAVGIHVTLASAGTSAALFAATLGNAVRRSGYSEAAEATVRAEEPQAAADAALSQLADERCAFVVDDAHLAGQDAAALVAHMVATLSSRQRMIVLARRLPSGAGRLRREEWLHLTSSDLMLVEEETLRLCRDGFGLDVGRDAVRVLEQTTAGWTAAAVLAIGRARRTGEDLENVARRATERGGAFGSVSVMMDEPMSLLSGSDLVTLAQLARLPALDTSFVDAVGGRGLWRRALDAGIPFVIGHDESCELPGPVRDLLSTCAAPDPGIMSRAAFEYRRRGEPGTALELLASHGFDEMAAALIASEDFSEIELIDVMLLRAIVDGLAPAALEAHPMALVQLARNCGIVAMMRARADALEKAAAIAARAGDPELDRALALERARELAMGGRFADAEEAARALLSEATAGERLTRAGAYAVLGRAVCWRTDDDGCRDLASMDEADRDLAIAMRLYEEAGFRAAAAVLAPFRAMWIAFAKGDHESAIRLLDAGAELAPHHRRAWASLLVYRQEVETELGCFEDAEATGRQILRVADDLNDHHLRSYVSWNGFVGASYRCDEELTLDLVRRTEKGASDWWNIAGADFLVSASESLGRVGQTALAFEYLERALANPGDSEPALVMAQAVLEARAGDAGRAEAMLQAAPCHRLDPRELWRVLLFRGLAAHRRGDRDAGALAARAFEESARMGQSQLPLVKERTVTEALIALAVETGQPAALALERSALPSVVGVLGGFRLTRGGREVAITSGLSSAIVKLLAVHEGRLLSDQVIDTLWPEAGSAAGRSRLRTALSRLKSEAGDLVERDGEALTLACDVEVDLRRFESEARRALALGPSEPALTIGLAHSAIARYRGEMLPDDLYEPWAERPRERARRLMLQLLDLCTDVAVARGDLDELRRVIDMTMDLAPYDDERPLRGARVLLRHGRRGAAMVVVHRARRALEELGLGPSDALLSLETEIGA